MEIVNLHDDLNKLVHNYSGGMKRRLSLAAALLHEPELLILDEPTVGIDPLLRKSIWDSFNELNQKGVTIIVTTHVMDEAEKCHRLGMIRNGELIAVGTPSELRTNTNTASLEDAFLAYGGAH
jgi:ABC-2 type transport system ATP-binding protein